MTRILQQNAKERHWVCVRCMDHPTSDLPGDARATDANGFSEIIERGVHGDITSPGDVHAIAELLESWQGPGRCSAARGACLRLASEFSMEKNARETLGVLQGVVAK